MYLLLLFYFVLLYFIRINEPEDIIAYIDI
jgi:hypothetical protein